MNATNELVRKATEQCWVVERAHYHSFGDGDGDGNGDGNERPTRESCAADRKIRSPPLNASPESN